MLRFGCFVDAWVTVVKLVEAPFFFFPALSRLGSLVVRPKMASAIYILSEKGQQLVGRDFRGDLPPRQTEKFIARVRDEEEQTSLKVASLFVCCNSFLLLSNGFIYAAGF